MRNFNPMKPWETPVYRAQCRTWAKAKQLAGIVGDAVRCDIEAELADPSPAFGFRMLPQYRSEGAKKLRKLVADAIRAERRKA